MQLNIPHRIITNQFCVKTRHLTICIEALLGQEIRLSMNKNTELDADHELTLSKLVLVYPQFDEL